jgi:hypothetical protein
MTTHPFSVSGLGLCLLSGTALTDSDLARMISIIRRCRK